MIKTHVARSMLEEPFTCHQLIKDVHAMYGKRPKEEAQLERLTDITTGSAEFLSEELIEFIIGDVRRTMVACSFLYPRLSTEFAITLGNLEGKNDQ